MIEEQTEGRGIETAEEFVTRSDEETFEIGRHIGEQIKGSEIFLLSGDLGAGKTVFAKGLASGLGIDPVDVTSPSFTLVNIHEGRMALYHIDLYRLDAVACQNLGLEEIFEEENAVAVIEWAERLGYAPPGAARIEFEYVTDSERRITIRSASQS